MKLKHIALFVFLGVPVTIPAETTTSAKPIPGVFTTVTPVESINPTVTGFMLPIPGISLTRRQEITPSHKHGFLEFNPKGTTPMFTTNSAVPQGFGTFGFW